MKAYFQTIVTVLPKYSKSTCNAGGAVHANHCGTLEQGP